MCSTLEQKVAGSLRPEQAYVWKASLCLPSICRNGHWFIREYKDNTGRGLGSTVPAHSELFNIHFHCDTTLVTYMELSSYFKHDLFSCFVFMKNCISIAFVFRKDVISTLHKASIPISVNDLKKVLICSMSIPPDGELIAFTKWNTKNKTKGKKIKFCDGIGGWVCIVEWVWYLKEFWDQTWHLHEYPLVIT